MAKNNNKTLIIILVVLLGVFALVQLNTRKKESTLKRDLVDIDTAKVTAIYLYPQSEKGKELVFVRSDKGWRIKEDGKEAPVETATVRNLLATTLRIKPQQLVAVGKDAWSEYHVDDSLATRLKIMEDNKTVLDLYIGKFSVQRPSGNNPYQAYGGGGVTGKSYVRLAGDKEIYAVEGFLPMTFNQGFDAWRDQRFLKLFRDDIQKITYTYPADTGFVLHNDSTGWDWKLDNGPVDSAAVAQYLSLLSHRRYSNFADGYTPPAQADYQMLIEGKNFRPVVIKAFRDDKYNLVIHSGQNPESYFADKDSTIFKLLFVPRSKFLPKEK
jgi:hypothetical protein